MIAVIDYGMGNIGSIINMFHKIGAEAFATNDIAKLWNADKLVLPGVGSFDNGIRNLNKLGLIAPLKELVLQEKKPIIGICLGMQLFGNCSEEGTLPGLGFIDFEVKRFEFSDGQNLKIPHMGWDIVKLDKFQDRLLEGLEGSQRYYFVHSYHAVCQNPNNVMMTCEYGYEFVAAVHSDNIYGVQFHPEKSHKYGMALLENFVRRI